MRPNLLRWLPALLWFAGILYFSSQPQPLGFLFPHAGAHDPVNGAFIAPQEQTARPLFDSPGSIRASQAGQVAHVLEYGGLAVLLAWALGLGPNPHRRPRLVLSLALSALLALGDEAYQELFPNRGFELADVALDVIGAALALAVVWWLTDGRAVR